MQLKTIVIRRSKHKNQEDSEEYNLTDDEEKLFELLTWIFDDGGLYGKAGYFDNEDYEKCGGK